MLRNNYEPKMLYGSVATGSIPGIDRNNIRLEHRDLQQ